MNYTLKVLGYHYSRISVCILTRPFRNRSSTTSLRKNIMIIIWIFLISWTTSSCSSEQRSSGQMYFMKLIFKISIGNKDDHNKLELGFDRLNILIDRLNYQIVDIVKLNRYFVDCGPFLEIQEFTIKKNPNIQEHYYSNFQQNRQHKGWQ